MSIKRNSCTRVILKIGQKVVKDILNDRNPGSTRRKALARSYIWWPRMDDNLEGVVKNVASAR